MYLLLGIKDSSPVVLNGNYGHANILGMDHVVTIENEENHKEEENLTIKLNST